MTQSMNDAISTIGNIVFATFEEGMDEIRVHCRVNYGFSSFSARSIGAGGEQNVPLALAEKRVIADCIEDMGVHLGCHSVDNPKEILLVVSSSGEFRVDIDHDPGAD